jgi:methionyl-tRNA formyltransferase
MQAYPRIVFLGTPDFAVASLEALLAAGFNVVGVVTAPDKPAGRGMQLQQSAVKQFAVRHNLPVLQPEKLKNPEFLAALKALKADVQVVVAFRMLPEIVWNMPPLGTINVHGSLLPQYRGAAPINWAIINGETTTGVTTFQLQHAIDTGNVLLRASLPIGSDTTAGELHDAMKVLGATTLVQTMQGILNGSIQPQPQQALADESTLKHAPKIFTETCKINWEQNAVAIHNLIRGLSPFPGAFTTLQGKTCKIFRSTPILAAHHLPQGSIYTDGKTYLRFACTDGFVEVLELQLEGKKKLPVTAFLAGFRM